MASEVRAPRLAAADDPVVRRLADDGLYLGITAWTEPSLVESGELYPPTATTSEQLQRCWVERYAIALLWTLRGFLGGGHRNSPPWR